MSSGSATRASLRMPRRVDLTTGLLAFSFAALAAGNLIIPDVIHTALPVDYLYVTLGILALFTVAHLNYLASHIGRTLLIVLFVLSLVPGALQTTGGAYGQSKLLGFGIAILLILTPLCLGDRLEKVVRAVSITLLTLSVIFSSLLLVFGADAANGRFSAFGLNPIGIARMTAVGAVFAFAFMIVRGTYSFRTKVLLLIVVIASMVSTIATGSRGPLAAAAAACAVMLVILVLHRRVNVYWLILVAIASIVSIQGLIDDGSGGLTRVMDGTDSGRGSIWADTLSVIASHPAGIGWGNLAYLLPQYVPAGSDTLYPHNLFLEMAVEGGWIALVTTSLLVIAAFAGTLRAIWRSNSPWPLVSLGLLTFSLVNAQVSSDIVGNRMMWLAIGIGLAYIPRRGGTARVG